jgi:hypothetical protein
LAAVLAEALDGLQAGMFLVYAGGRLIFANASGQAMLAQGNVLHSVAASRPRIRRPSGRFTAAVSRPPTAMEVAVPTEPPCRSSGATASIFSRIFCR